MLKSALLGAVLPLLLIAAGIAVFFLLEAPTPPKSTLPKPVAEELLPFMPRAEVAMVRMLAEKSETLDIRVNGSVVPYRELQLAAEVAGRIVEKDPDVRSGNYVKKGQVLFRIDPRDYQLELDRITQLRDQELASIKELQQDIENTQELVAVAAEEMKLADADVARLESLKAGISNAAELDQARRSRLSARNQQITLQNQVRAFEVRRTRIELAAKLAETQISQAKLNLARCEVLAPVSGRVVLDQVETDSYVQRGTNLLVIEDTEKVEVAANIRMEKLFWILDQPNLSTDELLNAARAARHELPPTPVEIEFKVAGRESIVYTWSAVLDRFDGAGFDPQSRTVPILIRVDEPNRVITDKGPFDDPGGPPMLVRGMFVDAVIKAKPTKPLMLVPKLSIKPASNSNVIWKFSPNQEALFATPIAKASLAEEEMKKQEPAEEEASKPDPALATNDEDSSEQKKTNPDDWETGYLEVIEQVRMVTAFWEEEDIDYWVCEVPKGKLEAGDFVITTPLPGIKADGSDPVRVEKAMMVDPPRELSSHAEIQKTGSEPS